MLEPHNSSRLDEIASSYETWITRRNKLQKDLGPRLPMRLKATISTFVRT